MISIICQVITTTYLNSIWSRFHITLYFELKMMKNQLILFTTIFALTAILAPGNCNDQLQKEAPKVEITVYYETMCPDCVRYIVQTLDPTYKLLQDIMTVQFIPYGKAITTVKPEGNGFNFNCQHGPKECLGNKVHACAIKYTELPILSDYIVCMIKNSYYPIESIKSCGKSLSISWERIEKCSSSIEGEKLLSFYGEKTHALNPKLKFVPTVELNGSQENQEALLNDLKGSVCSAYTGVKPSVCS